MPIREARAVAVEPVLVERFGGRGWLAMSPLSSEIRFAVVGDTKQAAYDEFNRSMRLWVEILGSNGKTEEDHGTAGGR